MTPALQISFTIMAKKRFLEGDFFEGYSLLGIVCGLPDFRTTHFINRQAHLDLKKYRDFSLNEGAKNGFSWYHYENEELRRDYYLIQNKRGTAVLLPELRNFDYLLLLYGNIPPSYRKEILTILRKTPYITAAFEQDLNKLKNGDLLIVKNEHHASGQKAQ